MAENILGYLACPFGERLNDEIMHSFGQRGVYYYE